MDHVTLIGVAASICTAISLIPQLVKLYKEKKSSGISVAMMALLFTEIALWAYYGVLKSDWVLILSNLMALFINMIIFFLMIHYRRRDESVRSRYEI